jgi:nanoRNase/pAp phosphatase (c-di-AMP/oligoRNAs hydrolase)
MQPIDIKAFQDKLEKAHSILLVLGQNPSFDQVAAALSLALAVGEGGKEQTVVCPTPMIVEFNRLVGVDKVTDSISDRNLTITFQNYNPEDIDKVGWDIIDGQFTLVVRPKPGILPPKKEQIQLEYKGMNPDLTVIVGAGQKDLGRIVEEAKDVVIVNNTPTSLGIPNAIELINPASASVSEVVFQIIESTGLPINKDIATNLLLGIKAGTNNFNTAKVSADTFATASRLMRAGATLDFEVTRAEVAERQEGIPPHWTQQPKIYKGSTLP